MATADIPIEAGHRCARRRGLILETERAVIVNSSAQATYRTILAQLRDRPGGTSAVKKMLAELPLNIRAGMNLAGYLALDDER